MHSMTRWGFALALLPLAACTTNPVNPMAATIPQPVVSSPTVNAVDQQFTLQAAASDLFETQSSQAALQNTRNPRVRGFAQHMIDAHGKTTQQLTQLATGKGITLQPALEPQQQKMVSDLQGMSPGRGFDRAYLNDQVTGHKAAVEVFQNEISNGSDPDLKAFAQSTLPEIRNHLRDAQRLGGR